MGKARKLKMWYQGSIKRKMTFKVAIYVSLILLSILSSYYYIFHEIFKERFQVEVTNVAATVASLIDGQEHNRLQTHPDENSVEYLKVQGLLQAFLTNNYYIKHIYTLQKLNGVTKWAYVVDADTTENHHHIGDNYAVIDQEVIKNAYNAPIADNDFETDQWGTFLSGFAPIKNSKGQTIGIVCVNMTAKNIIKQEIGLVVWALFLFVFGLGLMIHTTYSAIKKSTKPLDEIVFSIREWQLENKDLQKKSSIQTGDEFEVLGKIVDYASDLFFKEKRMLEEDLEKSKMERDKIFNVYRDVIFSVTQGKFNLLNESESNPISCEGNLLTEVKIAQLSDVNTARVLINKTLAHETYSPEKINHAMLCISEAATNVIKHANYGVMQIRKINNGIRVTIADDGPGMEMDKLPNMVFLNGFSTKISCGYGFGIINKFADKIYLTSSKNGTFLTMDFLEVDKLGI
ncbi:MAG TPA: ATP-binding protein [Desulfosporosinus sp.]|nr:ATP-binding protein [Desulfosporosinus sp.]